MALLKFALLCIDLVGWPAIALVYPLFVSSRAVETGSGYHMRKLVRYWIIFSLFSLLEFAFVKIIERIPFWSRVRLAVSFCLVMPQFEGACLAYQGLVSSVIVRFGMLMEERLCKGKTVLDVVDKYINENGSEALEKLIASQMTPPEASVENRCPETPLLKKSEQEWTCGLCKIANVGESTLNAHLRGSMHKSKLGILKASMLNEKDTGSSSLVGHAQSIPAAWDLKGSYAAAEVKEIMSSKETAEKLSSGTSLLKKSCQEWTCDLCKVTTQCEITLNGHLQGRKHKAKHETIRKESLVDAKDTGSFSPLVQHTQPVFAACDLKGTLEAAKDKEIMPPKETAELRLPETPLLKKAQQEWTGDLCRVHRMESVSTTWDLKGTYAAAEVEDLMSPKETAENRLSEAPLLKKVHPEGTGDVFNVTTKSESMLNDHVQGNQHKSKLESTLEASLLKAKDTGLSSLHTQPVSAAWVLKGTYVASEAREIITPKETAEKRSPEIPLLENAQQKWTSDLCKVTTTDEITLNGHLQGTKHKAKLETTMKECLLELEKHTASKNGHVEGSDSHRDIQVVKSGAKNGSSAALQEYMQPIEVPKSTYANTEVKETKPPPKASRAGTLPLKKEWNVKSEAKNGSSALQEMQYAQPIKVPEKSYANTEVKDTMPPPEASRAVAPPLKQKWSCTLCKVKVTREKDLNAHLLGSKHKAKLESRKRRKGKAGCVRD
ncbi:hypothetical protein AAHA92_30583 [Salvia divinorum]|uniref:C2H2-type domain-containing protein n=1 Tax=Salvia divinorum TaxID=28513 RepID=A0ABD1FU87_SALDI